MKQVFSLCDNYLCQQRLFTTIVKENNLSYSTYHVRLLIAQIQPVLQAWNPHKWHLCKIFLDSGKNCQKSTQKSTLLVKFAEFSLEFSQNKFVFEQIFAQKLTIRSKFSSCCQKTLQFTCFFKTGEKHLADSTSAQIKKIIFIKRIQFFQEKKAKYC